jgi:hypothetical protein
LFAGENFDGQGGVFRKAANSGAGRNDRSHGVRHGVADGELLVVIPGVGIALVDGAERP